MQAAIQAYYQEYYSVTPVVEKYYEDVNGTLVATDDWIPADHYTVYNVTVRSPIGGPGACTQRIRMGGNVPVAKKLEIEVSDVLLELDLALFLQGFILWKKRCPHAVCSRNGKVKPQRSHGVFQEDVRDLYQDSCSVTAGGLRALTAAVLHVLQHGNGVADDGSGLYPVDVGDKTNAAGVVLIRWVVKAFVFVFVCRHSRS